MKMKGYDSTTFHALLSTKIEAAFGHPPHEFQVDIGEALHLGLDAVLIAGTGAGKTLTFVMLLMLEENADKTVIVVSPLNELQRDQVSISSKMCIYAPLTVYMRHVGGTIQ